MKIYVLNFMWDVKNVGQDMDCCGVFFDLSSAHREMEVFYFEKLDELHADGVEESESSYVGDKSAYISADDAANFWFWKIDEMYVK